jgi:chaperonin GroES
MSARASENSTALDAKVAWHSCEESANRPLISRRRVVSSLPLGTLANRVPNLFGSPEISVEVTHMKLKPLGDRLIVKAVEEEETTASGIVLPDTAKEKPTKGKVVAVGDGKLDDDGKRIPLDVSEGDEVLYSKYGGTEITIEGEDLLVLRESDVLAKVQS